MRWIIGDVHGMLEPLLRLLEQIDARDPAPRLFFTGDFCDRGPETSGVVDLLLTLNNASFVRGNHDDVMDLCCSGKSFGTGPGIGGDVDDETLVEVYALFRGEGLTETLHSYGVHPADADALSGGETLADWVRRQFLSVPEAHKRFFRELPAVAEEEDFFVCHATWPADQLDEPGRMNGIVAGDPHLRHEVLWGRYISNQIRSKKVWRRTGYFGHTPTDNYLGNNDLIVEGGRIIRGEKCILIDTGAFSPEGRLTGVCHDDGTILQVRPNGVPIDANEE